MAHKNYNQIQINKSTIWILIGTKLRLKKHNTFIIHSKITMSKIATHMELMYCRITWKKIKTSRCPYRPQQQFPIKVPLALKFTSQSPTTFSTPKTSILAPKPQSISTMAMPVANYPKNRRKPTQQKLIKLARIRSSEGSMTWKNYWVLLPQRR